MRPELLPELLFASALVAIVLWMNVKATMQILRDSLSEPSQRLMQLLLVWLLPILGAIIVFAVHRPTERHPGKYRELPDPGDDFGFPRHGRGGRSNEGGDDD
jgi:hypothetical protein